MAYMDDQNAEYLINMYADTILRISFMYLKHTFDAEDICQEVFMKLLRSDLTFDSPAHEKAWIIRVTINLCKDHLRTSFWRQTVGIEKAADIPAPGCSDAYDTDLLGLLSTLPKNYRVSLYLHYYEGYQVKEIAGMLGKTENVISSYLSRGRKKLKALIEDSQINSTSHMSERSNLS